MFPAVAFVRSKRIFLATKATIKRHCRLPEKESSKETEGKKGSRLRFPIWQHFMEGHILQLYDRTRVNRWNYHPAKVQLGEIFFFSSKIISASHLGWMPINRGRRSLWALLFFIASGHFKWRFLPFIPGRPSTALKVSSWPMRDEKENHRKWTEGMRSDRNIVVLGGERTNDQQHFLYYSLSSKSLSITNHFGPIFP